MRLLSVVGLKTIRIYFFSLGSSWREEDLEKKAATSSSSSTFAYGLMGSVGPKTQRGE